MCGGAPSVPPPQPPPPPERLADLPRGQKAPTKKKKSTRSLRTVKSAKGSGLTTAAVKTSSGSPTLS